MGEESFECQTNDSHRVSFWSVHLFETWPETFVNYSHLHTTYNCFLFLLIWLQRNHPSAARSSVPEPPESSIATLVSMGFDSNSARQALLQARNDINVATNILLESQSYWLLASILPSEFWMAGHVKMISWQYVVAVHISDRRECIATCSSFNFDRDRCNWSSSLEVVSITFYARLSGPVTYWCFSLPTRRFYHWLYYCYLKTGQYVKYELLRCQFLRHIYNQFPACCLIRNL